MIWILRLLVAFFLTGVSTQALSAITVTGLELVSSKRIARTVFEYNYKVRLQNDATNWTNLKATLTGAGSGTTIIEGTVTVGPLSPNQVNISDDTITLRQERTSFFDRNALVWGFSEIPLPPTTGVLLPGNPSDPAQKAVYDHVPKNGVKEADIGIDINGAEFALTRIGLGFHPAATVGQVNAALESVSGRIIGMLTNDRFVVIEIPNPGTLPAFNLVLETLKASPGIMVASKSGFMDSTALPPSFLPLGPTNALKPIRHHLAIRSHAAWNISDSFFGKPPERADPPVVVMWDLWGGGVPNAGAGFNVRTTTGDFGEGEPNYHGYHVLGIMGAEWNDKSVHPAAPPAGLAGQSASGGFKLRVLDHSKRIDGVLYKWDNYSAFIKLIYIAKYSGDRVVINTSMGYPCEKEAANAIGEANIWIHHWTHAGLDKTALHIQSAGNIKPCWTYPAKLRSPAGVAALNDSIFDLTGTKVENLKNILVVENVIADGKPFSATGPNLGPVCTNSKSSDVPKDHPSVVAAIGTDVTSLGNPGAYPLVLTGTSMAAPQVSALAIWLWSLKPSLSVSELKAIIKDTAHSPPVNASANTSSWACSSAEMAPVVDAYRATLALDASETDSMKPDSIRMALFDVARADFNTVKPGDVAPDKKFDTADLRLWVKELLARKGSSFDYSRYDLNGDGQTGEIEPMLGSGRSFDLNGNKILEFVTKEIAGVNISFNESALSDAEILCYYAYSPLYTGDLPDGGLTDGDLFERSVLMIPILNQCGVKLKSVAATIGGSASGYTLPTTTVLKSFGTPIVPWVGSWSGTGTCGGEQGGPVWSSTVTTGAYFLPATVIDDAPMPNNLTYNRMPCSSFFAVNDGKVWLNATGRRYQNTSGFISDREYQTRYFSDPEYGISSDTVVARENTRKLRLGTVNVPAGNFFQSNLLTESTNTVEPIIFEFEAL